MKIKPCRRETAKKVVEILHNSLCDGLSSSKLLNVLLEEETFRRNSCVCACVSVREREREREREKGREGGRESERGETETHSPPRQCSSLCRGLHHCWCPRRLQQMWHSQTEQYRPYSLWVSSRPTMLGLPVWGGGHTHGQQTNFNEFIAVCACDVCTTNEREWLLQLEIS